MSIISLLLFFIPNKEKNSNRPDAKERKKQCWNQTIKEKTYQDLPNYYEHSSKI